MKNVKAIAFVSAIVISLVIAVMGWHWTDTAKTPFWWNFWQIAAIVAIPVFVGLIFWFDKSRKKW